MTKRVICLTRTPENQYEPVRVAIKVELRKKDNVSPYRDIDLAECHEYTELSICGSVWLRGDRRNDPSLCDQCIDDVLQYFGDQATGPDGGASVAELCEIWRRWHLNGMRAGTRAQGDYLREHPPEPPFYPTTHYDKAVAALAKVGLWVDRDYRYGHAWLVERLPDEVVKRVVEICDSFAAKLDPKEGVAV